MQNQEKANRICRPWDEKVKTRTYYGNGKDAEDGKELKCYICESSNKIGESSNLINLYFICNYRGYPAMPRSINATQYDWL